MGRARKGKKAAPPLSKNTLRALHIIMAIGFISAVPQILTTVMTTWREAEPIEYKYMFRGSEHSLYVDYTYYGLYKVIYDDKHVETWTQRVQNMRSKGSEGIQVGRNSESAGSLSLWTSACQEACRDAIIRRIEAYERVSFISLILLCGIVLSCTIIILCIGWNILFSKSILISMACFMLSFIINGGIGTYWYYETDLSWNLVTKAQQYPFPKCSYCFYIFMITTGVYALCFFFLLMLDLYNKNSQKKSHLDQMTLQNRNAMNAKNLYQPLFDGQANMMMSRSASYTNLMPYGKGAGMGGAPMGAGVMGGGPPVPNFLQFNKTNLNQYGGINHNGFPGFRNMPPGMGMPMPPGMSPAGIPPGVPPGMGPGMTSGMTPEMGPGMTPEMGPGITPGMGSPMQHNLNPNFFPQMPRQYSYSGSPSFQQGLPNFNTFQGQNMPQMSSGMFFPRQYSGIDYENINNPFSVKKPFKF
ncbi:claudin-like apicomplexan microneme protein, putative [Plasmodium vivax]|uniref:Claudin-like apicomplexan microneme protein n=1 Tax=Plasmodium vivax (strain Salvador I) TaxID=126793 RepID=A5KDZ5_PLAVS|nr:hypothetical protein, conserved [Plasmodium vivax]EDL42444.1 hypothetical protein, conserved [Plasmodium vivax]CAI7719257.1 claudin-like apicomplexan microneme protein, putative [Plasmodium vivax]|eukprot:XP_001608468.1 hypothetical protein [Plasmodium vivax Sal-1]